MSWIPYLVVIVLLGGLMLVTTRNRRRQVAEDMVRVSRIDVGTEVMTTSGLYGTVVARHEDDTVLLAIAPGVEVKWAVAALRDAPSLSENYRRGLESDVEDEHPADRAASSGVDLDKGLANGLGHDVSAQRDTPDEGTAP